MTTPSILDLHPVESDAPEPAYFPDLNLDQVIDDLTLGRADYNLAPLFHRTLPDLDAVAYRHEVFHDLDTPAVLAAIDTFAGGMRDVREALTAVRTRHYRRQKQCWLLDAADRYCQTVTRLAHDLDAAQPASRGLRAIREFCAHHIRSPLFRALRDDTTGLRRDLAAIRYSVEINGNRVNVRNVEPLPDYSAQIAATFERFRRGAPRQHLTRYTDYADMNHVEASILDCVAELNPELFTHLDAYTDRYGEFRNDTIRRLDREAQFYLTYRAHMQRLSKAGLPFCYPTVTTDHTTVAARDTYDLALAGMLVDHHTPVVRNDLQLTGDERLIVVSGPNQGGKTTFARTVGQLHHLAALGCPVPGSTATLMLCDRILTHFERRENLTDLRGKLQDDLVRIHDIVQQATDHSLVILNELFTSTTLVDARYLGRQVIGRLIDVGAVGVYVTFIDELAALDASIVSMVSTVEPDNPAQRTYRVVRRPADGRAYALAIADKYGLTYERLKERIPS